MEMQKENKRNPKAIFMAFGTKGDVYPIAAIAAAFSCDQEHYSVIFISHSAHENLGMHLAPRKIVYLPVSSPSVLSPNDYEDADGSLELSFSVKKMRVAREHRRECFSILEKIFGDDSKLEDTEVSSPNSIKEGWSLAELYQVPCAVAAPYVVPYSAPSSFERRFRKELPLLYEYLQLAPVGKVSWKDVNHWMWPLFCEDWGSWRTDDLNLSPFPFTDPVTGLPIWHDRSPSPLLLYGFSGEVVECPDYWPSNVQVCGFWVAPMEWQFSCSRCHDISDLISSAHFNRKNDMCSSHEKLYLFVNSTTSGPCIFIGLSSIGSMGFMKNPQAFLQVLQSLLQEKNYRFVLFSAGHEPLDEAVRQIGAEKSGCSEEHLFRDGLSLFEDRLFFFPGSVAYDWLFPRCKAVLHHGGSGSTASALRAGIPQVLCPFILDQFYWAERMFWLGVAPEPLERKILLPDTTDKIRISEAATAISQALDYALSPRVKARASEIAERISHEDGVSEAVKILKKEMVSRTR